VIDTSESRDAWNTAVKNYIWKHSSELSLSREKVDQLKEASKLGADNVKTEGNQAVGKTVSKKELINRRYKVFTSDLEKAVIYSISHEVAQHSSIAGHTLGALQEYVTVLEKYFPARIEMAVFLRDLHSWVHMHQDAIRGEDLSAWIESYQGRHGVQASNDWIGCKGSEIKYGGYPCGLWSLWHALTIQQANMAEGDPKEVLKAMFSFIKEFFGCRECARHFDKVNVFDKFSVEKLCLALQALEGGKAIEQEVETYNDAILLLWRAHNKANFRLSGDISEDPVFPKQVFPSKEFCAGCYNLVQGE
jgi:thiol oxidase